MPEKDVPLAIRREKTNPWFIKGPPFDGWFWTYDWTTRGGTLTDWRHQVGVELAPFTYINGQIGHYSRYENYSASNSDYLSLEFRTGVGFWYRPPDAGNKQMWIRMRFKNAQSAITLQDEWGWSSSNTQMLSTVTLDVAQVLGQEGQTELWHANWNGAPNAYQHIATWRQPETVWWLNLSTALPPGWSFIWIGTFDKRDTFLNDVSTSQSMNNRIVIEQVYIEED